MQIQRTAQSASDDTNSIIFKSPNFDARTFLRQVHLYISYEDLVGSVDYLRKGLALKNETLKNLVKDNFDRFVNAKNSIDSVYGDLRGRGMNSGDFGMRAATQAINGNN